MARTRCLWLCGAALASLASLAAAQGVYRYTGPDGRTVYTDDPTAGRGTATKVDIPAPPAGKPAQGLSAGERALLEQSNRRMAELDRATTDIVAAFNSLRTAEARLADGVEPLEGERAGRRYRPEYWERQQSLRRDVDEARARLNDALARRNALR